MVRLDLPDVSSELRTDSGVFSADRVDPGTKVLLVETAAHPSVVGLPRGDLVDVGAGYGPIATTLALRHPQRTVWAVEPNARARELCAANAAAAGVQERIMVVPPDEVPDTLTVAGIFSNPPIRIGKRALHDLITFWLARLDTHGYAWLVVQRNLGADSLARWITDTGYEVTRVASRRGYRVLRVNGPER